MSAKARKISANCEICLEWTLLFTHCSSRDKGGVNLATLSATYVLVCTGYLICESMSSIKYKVSHWFFVHINYWRTSKQASRTLRFLQRWKKYLNTKFWRTTQTEKQTKWPYGLGAKHKVINKHLLLKSSRLEIDFESSSFEQVILVSTVGVLV